MAGGHVGHGGEARWLGPPRQRGRPSGSRWSSDRGVTGGRSWRARPSGRSPAGAPARAATCRRRPPAADRRARGPTARSGPAAAQNWMIQARRWRSVVLGPLRCMSSDENTSTDPRATGTGTPSTSGPSWPDPERARRRCGAAGCRARWLPGMTHRQPLSRSASSSASQQVTYCSGRSGVYPLSWCHGSSVRACGGLATACSQYRRASPVPSEGQHDRRPPRVGGDGVQRRAAQVHHRPIGERAVVGLAEGQLEGGLLDLVDDVVALVAAEQRRDRDVPLAENDSRSAASRRATSGGPDELAAGDGAEHLDQGGVHGAPSGIGRLGRSKP